MGETEKYFYFSNILQFTKHSNIISLHHKDNSAISGRRSFSGIGSQMSFI
jgi:hypothetical protein